MSLDLNKLVHAKTQGGKLIAQCPACAAAGGDKSGEHLVIFEDGAGKWGCVQYGGDKDHRREIAALVGVESTAAFTPRARPPARPAPPPRKLNLPVLRVPTVGELTQIAEVRKLPGFTGLELAVRAGQLRCAKMRDDDDPVE